MKHLLLLTLLCSCSNGEDHKKYYQNVHTTEFEVDGCEYVVYQNGNQGGITHKGNCKNH